MIPFSLLFCRKKIYCRFEKYKKILAAVFVLFLINFFTTHPAQIFAVTIYDEYGNPVRVVNTPKGSLPSNQQNATESEKSESKSTKTKSDEVSEKKSSRKKFNTDKTSKSNSSRNFDYNTIEKSNSASLSDFLRQKGFLVMSSGGMGSKQELSFKGFTSFCIKVYVDGIYANNPATGEFDWNSIDLDSIESIEVSEKPRLGATEFAGCSIYITTKQGAAINGKDGREEVGESNLSSESNGDNTGNAGGTIATHTAFSSYETKFFDSVFQSVRYSNCADTNSDGTNNFKYDIFSSIGFYDNFYKKGNYGAVNSFNPSQNANVNFNWSDVINKNISMTGSNIFSFNQLKVLNSGQNLTTGLERDYMTKNDISINLKYDMFEFITNLSYFYGQVDYLEKYDITNYKNSDIDQTNSQMVYFSENMTNQWIDAFVSYRETHSFSANKDRHEICFGLGKKYDFEKYDIDWFSIEPNFSLLFYSTASTTLETKNSTDLDSQNMTWYFEYLPSLMLYLDDFFISAYRLLTLPTFNQLYWPETSYARGNKSLKPESGWAASLGYKSDFPIFATFTYSYYENKIRWTSIKDDEGKVILMPANTANADFYAFTLGYEQEVWKKNVSVKDTQKALSLQEGTNERSLQTKNASLILSVDGTVTEARLRENLKQIMWVPEYQAHGGISFKYGGLELSTDYSFTSKRYKTNDNSSSYPAIHLLNASVSYDFIEGKANSLHSDKTDKSEKSEKPEKSRAEKFLIYAKATNLLDQKVVYHDGYYIPSRKWTLGVKFVR